MIMVKSSAHSGRRHQNLDEFMLKIWIILVTATGFAVSAVHTTHMAVLHGEDLTLDIPDRTDALKFISADEQIHSNLWKRDGKVLKGRKLRVRQHVTFKHTGTYTLFNVWNKEISSYTVKVKGVQRNVIRAPGETLNIPLDGIELESATLFFNGDDSNVTLVNGGEPVANRDPKYINRLQVTSKTINVLKVNVSDLGEYILKDHKRRIVSKSTLILVERHSTSSNKKALIALVLLVIPVIICCYCMIKFCCTDDESNTANTKTLNAQPESVPMCQTVTDPSQCYPTLPVQGQIQYPPTPQWNGQPAVPPYPNPVYPPGPVGPPAQPPQLNVHPNQYYPPAPVNFNPLMNNASPGLYPTTA
ncbi:hypothetical protein E1301_Tti009123 [Triplophysa tibetana]|uniref:Uncharacterized protein n=1 Tax=Triplophysa tibetana TaxID=1572043 RepID=A0A5A9PM87_9TELE|nr:hypothetical protein E1301_Tti009123 [Triplophysa tibetana]